MDFLSLNSNAFEGTIPSQIGLLTKLVSLWLSDTQLSGTVPEELYMWLSPLEWLDLSNSALSGTISNNIGLLTNLGRLYLSGNKFHGTVPATPESLEHLHVNGNDLTGTMPESLCRNQFQKTASFVADCGSNNETGVPELLCDCCTECCDPITGICIPSNQ